MELVRDKAFKSLKDDLTPTGMLVHFDPDKPITLAVDASPVGLGAVISHDVDGQKRAIAFASRSVSHAEQSYLEIEREALAIIFGVHKFHEYLYLRKSTLLTVNKPLAFTLGPKKIIPSIAASRGQR